MKNIYGNERGVSLIEILVVLVILLVGIMSAIRVFPTGFGLIQHSADVTLASRFAQHELAIWTQDPDSLPNGIIPVVASYGLPGKDNCNDFRDVMGEGAVVPACDSSVPDAKPTYVVRMGPVEDPTKIEVRTAALAQEPFTLSGITPSYEKLLQPDPPQVRDLQRYQIDEDAVSAGGTPQPMLYFRPTGYPTTLYIDYDYIDNSGNRVQWRTLKDLSGNANYPAGAMSGLQQIEQIELPLPSSGFSALVPGSVKVYRALKPGSTSGQNPFCFAVHPDATAAALGVIQFHPDLQGTPVRINYRVRDWRYIHEDLRAEEDPSNPNQSIIRTSLPFIKDPNSGNAIKEGYTFMAGLPADTAAIAEPLDENASFMNFKPFDPIVGQAANDLRAGILRSAQIPPGALVRVYYCVEGEWAVWMSKAFSHYALQTGTTLDPGQYRYAGGNKYGNQWEVQLEFPLCDAGQAAIADLQLLDNSGRIEHNYQGVYFTIDDHPSAGNGPGSRIALGTARLDLPPGFTGNPTIKVANVRGVSVKVCVAWKENGKVKLREVDSILSR